MEGITMADDATSTTDAAAETSGDSAEATATEANATEAQATDDGGASLGDAGKKAIDAMKAERNSARAEARELQAKLAELQAKAEGKEAEFTAAQEAQRIKDEALSAANERILKAEVRAAAAAKLNDPQDALRFLNLSEFEVGSDGEVDASQVAQAIDDLIASKPYLAAQGGQRFTGDVDGGARKVTPPASIEEQVAELQKAGNHKAASALKAAQLLELRNTI